MQLLNLVCCPCAKSDTISTSHRMLPQIGSFGYEGATAIALILISKEPIR